MVAETPNRWQTAASATRPGCVVGGEPDRGSTIPDSTRHADPVRFEYQHYIVNPSLVALEGQDSVSRACKAMEAKGWGLSHIVSNGPYQSVLVFMRQLDDNTVRDG